MDDRQFIIACEKELRYIEKQELKLQKQAMAPERAWKQTIEGAIPDKVYDKLRAAFAAAFKMIFEKGVNVIEKTYSRDKLMKDFELNDMAVDSFRSRRELRKFRSDVSSSHTWKSILTTVEGMGLGAIGIGMPDIVIFLGFVLQSIYEVALKYGYDYNDKAERVFILKMMSASIARREKWLKADKEVEEMIRNPIEVDFDVLDSQISDTADDFALDMLVLKFIQGKPIVGIIGGLSNPIYYNKIMEYVKLKYHKRYLLSKKAEVLNTKEEIE